MESIGIIFQDFWNSLLVMLPKVASAIVVLVVFIVVGSILKRVFNSRVQARWKNTVIPTFLGSVVKWGFILVGLLFAFDLMGFGGVASGIVAGAGISAIIIGFAFKDIAENFLAGMLLASTRPFKVGDIIQSDSFKGPVKKLDMRVTHIRTADGRDIYVPNSMIVKNVLINYTKDGLLRQEFIVGIDTEDDVSKARDLVLAYFDKQKDVLKTPRPNLAVDEIGVSSVNVKVLFWVDVLKVNRTIETESDTGELVKSRVMREIQELLLANGFSLPSVVIEHKMYRSSQPLELHLRQKSDSE